MSDWCVCVSRSVDNDVPFLIIFCVCGFWTILCEFEQKQEEREEEKT